jgi:DNA-binding HxlR family transcriptional regulator
MLMSAKPMLLLHLRATMRVTNVNVSGYSVPSTEEDCAVEATVAVIGGKWKPILLFHLVSGAKRFSELKKLLPQASDRMLTRSLRELENDRLLTRKVFAEVPTRVEYTLSEDGKSLIPVLNAMSEWGSSKRRGKL